MTAVDALFVGIGGGLGSLARWGVGKAVGAAWPGVSFPLGTFLINVSGAFVIGLLATLFRIDFATRYGDILTAGVLTGFLGGYTTFSSMQLDAAKLASRSGQGRAAFYLLVSVLAGGLAAALGIACGRMLVTP